MNAAQIETLGSELAGMKMRVRKAGEGFYNLSSIRCVSRQWFQYWEEVTPGRWVCLCSWDEEVI